MSPLQRQRCSFVLPTLPVALALFLLASVHSANAQVLTFEPQPLRIINPQLADPGPIIHAGGPETMSLASQGTVVFAVPNAPTLNAPIQLAQAVEPFSGSTTGTATNALPNWDPYGTSGSPSRPLFGSGGSEFFEKVPDTSKKIARRFIERVSLDYTYIPRGGENGLGINEIAYQTEFTFPCRYLYNSEPIYVVPGFDLLFWDGPLGPPTNPHHFSSSGYNAYLEVGTAPRKNKDFAFELWGRAGLYSDFHKITADSFRLSGNASVLIGLTNEAEGVLGVVYLNRSRIKILPRIGVIWKPNEKVTWKLVFPDPKLSRFLAKVNNVDWTFYLQGHYGGGCWTISDPENDRTYLTDYNDVRIGVGIEFANYSTLNGFVELGGAFGRELYSEGETWYKPPSAIYLRAGFHF
ncbi:MAG: hypothetical protein FWC43_14140 [Planctomycetaceae bacterium]|nr:hypothetical protein [Planctomycetaceae bacterium]